MQLLVQPQTTFRINVIVNVNVIVIVIVNVNVKINISKSMFFQSPFVSINRPPIRHVDYRPRTENRQNPPNPCSSASSLDSDHVTRTR